MGKKALKVYKDATDDGYGDLDYTGIIEYLKKQFAGSYRTHITNNGTIFCNLYESTRTKTYFSSASAFVTHVMTRYASYCNVSCTLLDDSSCFGKFFGF